MQGVCLFTVAAGYALALWAMCVNRFFSSVIRIQTDRSQHVHWLGLQGQWRRVANFNYNDPIISGWGPWVIASFVGGLVLLASAVLLIRNLVVLHRSERRFVPHPIYTLAIHPVRSVPAALNGFGIWNALLVVLMIASYALPIGQFFVAPSPGAMVHRLMDTAQ